MRLNRRRVVGKLALGGLLAITGCERTYESEATFTAKSAESHDEGATPTVDDATRTTAGDSAPGLDPAPGPLAAQLDEMAEGAKSRLPAEMLETFEQGVRDVASSGALESAMKVGDVAPGFELPSATGESVSLASLLGTGPVVLMWYRGGWCPYCNLALGAMQERLADIEGAGATLVAISPELPDRSLTTKEKGELAFPVLSDTKSEVAKAYGVAYTLPEVIQPAYSRLNLPERNGDDSLLLPLAATYVIDRDGVIRWAFVDADYKKRAEPQDVIDALQALK